MFWKTIILAAGVSIASQTQAQDAWRGPYLELMAGRAIGEHGLEYQNDEYGLNIGLYDFGTSGNVYALAAGYRRPVFDTPLHLGVELSVNKGTVSGGQRWGDVASVTFQSDTVFTLSGQLGYAINDNWFLYGQYGVAAAEIALRGQVAGRSASFNFSDKLEGWTIGPFAAIGVTAQPRRAPGWTIGVELQYIRFEGDEDFNFRGRHLGRLHAEAEQKTIFVTLGRQF